MNICCMSFDNFIKSKKVPKIRGQYHIVGGEIPIFTEPYIGDTIFSVDSHSEKWLYKICDSKLYLAPAFRYQKPDEKYVNTDPTRLRNLIKKNYGQITKFIKNHFLECNISCSFPDDIYIRMNSRYMGNFIKKMSIECNGQSQEWFYHITHWDGWFSTLIEPFTEFKKDDFLKKDPFKMNVARHESEIKNRIMKSYEFDLKSIKHATKGDQLLKKNRNKKFAFQINDMKVTVNPDEGHFDYKYLLYSQPKIRKFTKSGFRTIYITRYKFDPDDNKIKIVEQINKPKKEIKYKSQSKTKIENVLKEHENDNMVTVVGGFYNENLFKNGAVFRIEKEPNNPYDAEAIAVEYDGEIVAYIANSIDTVVKGTMSAGRIYDKFDTDSKIEIIFNDDGVIAKLI